MSNTTDPVAVARMIKGLSFNDALEMAAWLHDEITDMTSKDGSINKCDLAVTIQQWADIEIDLAEASQ